MTLIVGNKLQSNQALKGSGGGLMMKLSRSGLTVECPRRSRLINGAGGNAGQQLLAGPIRGSACEAEELLPLILELKMSAEKKTSLKETKI